MPRKLLLGLFWFSIGLVWTHPLNPQLNAPSISNVPPLVPGHSEEIMPDRLRDWILPPGTTDYADQIQRIPDGDLRWRHFPVRVAIQPVGEGDPWTLERDRLWVEAMSRAIEEWQVYFPLILVPVPDDVSLVTHDLWEFCDIYIQRSRPPAQRLRDGTILPARLADTRYWFVSLPVGAVGAGFKPAPTAPALRFRIRIGTQQGTTGLQATARHELGHALGLWGHSPDPEDVMYAAQTGLYPPISDRDVQTLKWVYSQRQIPMH